MISHFHHFSLFTQKWSLPHKISFILKIISSIKIVSQSHNLPILIKKISFLNIIEKNYTILEKKKKPLHF